MKRYSTSKEFNPQIISNNAENEELHKTVRLDTKNQKMKA